ncbi:MAG TPA: ThiF family adenylyltransferase [Chitinophagaceae bacterium]|jgi:molybdopterin/thiamine biosynthesis adenylyltransferase|nr:ThiF family adenylyltransferase [Chitinophagaceae bacterium]
MKSLERTNKEEFSVAISATLNSQLIHHLHPKGRQEEVAFALYKPSLGKLRFTALIHEIILPEKDERVLQGNVKINPAFFRRACKKALADESGIALLHSHFTPGWQGMSNDDFKTEFSYSSNSFDLTSLPFIGLTLGTDGAWSARIWEYQNDWYEKKSAASVRVVGKQFEIYYNDTLRPKPVFQEIFKRTWTVWGEKNHEKLARLRIGIVGLGSVGSMVAEGLARMGIERLVLLDFDEVQRHNLDRLLGASIQDIGHHKALVAARQIYKNGTASHIQVTPVMAPITEEEGYQHALDCDIIFSCVDRPWPRHVLNHLAYQHLIPVIDGGIGVKMDTNTHLFESANWQLQCVSPERPCLQCLNAYNPSDVSTEKEGLLEDPTYLKGLPANHQFKSNENIFPFSMNLASLEIMQFIEFVTGIGQNQHQGTTRYSYNHGFIRLGNKIHCEDGCFFAGSIASGDSLFEAPIGFDHSAELARIRQSQGGVRGQV